MGQFVADEKNRQGWLANLSALCCWTASDTKQETEMDHKQYSHSASSVCHEQPKPLKVVTTPRRPPSYPVTRPFQYGDEFVRDEDRFRPVSVLPPSLMPLDLGDNTLLDRDRLSWSSRHKTSPMHSNRPSIGQPTDFRRLDYTESQRHSLIPLKLGPVVLNPQPDGNGLPPGYVTRSSDDLFTSSNRSSYGKSGETSMPRYPRNSQIFLPDSPHVTTPDRALTFQSSQRDLRITKPALSTHSSSSSMRSLQRQAPESLASTTPPRPSSEITQQSSASSLRSFRRFVTDSGASSTPVRPIPRLNKKRSGQSTRKSTPESIDWEIDREILELNTIVEERRAEAARGQSPDDKHIPAVAPSMAGRARSETLNDIGSAFSKPLLAGSLPVVMTKRLSRPFTSIPEPFARPASAQSDPQPGSRLSGWLYDLLPSPAASVDHGMPEKRGPSDRHRIASQISLLSSATDAEVPALSTASSPTSQSHSRSLTAESKIPAVSSLPTLNEHLLAAKRVSANSEESWSGAMRDGSLPVGLAI